MIVKAAVKILDYKQNKIITIPVHRHCDAFYILKEFGYKAREGYKEIEQGFLDEKDNFYSRVAAYEHAWKCGQINDEICQYKALYSEDLW